ncbi:hypothetical protein [Lactococcus ileimucosae]|uniref:hypothetical protein n=1 Tax=Lactococcus ileimucosae TaxID=2941329 RepID=UPI002042FCE7|nr:hypothetical protein [Lactococcus ileimucosae]
MTGNMCKRIEESIGYQNMIEGMNEVFGDSYKIEKLISSDDETSFDFSTVTNIGSMSGIDIGVEGSGDSHQFQTGFGTISAGIPIEDAFFILPSGKKGASLSEIIQDKDIKFGASADKLEQIIEYLEKLRKYLNR